MVLVSAKLQIQDTRSTLLMQITQKAIRQVSKHDMTRTLQAPDQLHWTTAPFKRCETGSEGFEAWHQQ